MLELALKYGIFNSISTRVELPDGSKTFGKTIYKDPEKYFTEDILKQINEKVYDDFMYGQGQQEIEEDEPIQVPE